MLPRQEATILLLKDQPRQDGHPYRVGGHHSPQLTASCAELVGMTMIAMALAISMTTTMTDMATTTDMAATILITSSEVGQEVGTTPPMEE